MSRSPGPLLFEDERVPEENGGTCRGIDAERGKGDLLSLQLPELSVADFCEEISKASVRVDCSVVVRK